jgi:hypothetical protein
MSQRPDLLAKLEGQIIIGNEIERQGGNAQELFGTVADKGLARGLKFSQDDNGDHGLADGPTFPIPVVRPLGYEEDVQVRNEQFVGVQPDNGEKFVGREQVNLYLEAHPEIRKSSSRPLIEVIAALSRWAPTNYVVAANKNNDQELHTINVKGIRLGVLPKVLRFVMSAQQGYAIGVANYAGRGRGSALAFSAAEKAQFFKFCNEAVVLPSDIAEK